MKRLLTLILVCALLSVSVTGHPLPAVKAAGEVLYVEIPQDSYCRAPATTAYLPIMMGNLSDQGTMTIRSVEVLDAKGQVVATERTEFKLESLAGKAGSSEEIRTALGIVPPTAADITTARAFVTEAASTVDRKQKSILVERAFFASRAKQSMKNPDELTADEAKIQQLLKTTTLAVDLTRITTDTASETAVLVTVRITGELAGQPFTVDQQTMVYLLASLPNGGMWHPGDGHVHTEGVSQPDTASQYPSGQEEYYGFSDAIDGAGILSRRNEANSRGLQWFVATDHAGQDGYTGQPRLEVDEWNPWNGRSIYKMACARATTQYSPTVTVCPGEELATFEGSGSTGTGHLLSYANSSYAASYGACQTLTTNVFNAGGFGIVAHPYNPSFSWSDWNATPRNGLEVMSNESVPNTSATSTWDNQLLSQLNDEIYGQYRCVAMANSDVHSILSAGWGANMNYIYTGSYSVPGISPSVVWDAIRNGRSTASSDGSFAAATVNGAYPGSSMRVARNSTVSTFVTGTTAFSSNEYAWIRVFRNGTEVGGQPPFHSWGNNFTQTISVQVPSDSYIRVEVWYGVLYAGGAIGWNAYCLVNPVFIGVN
jgi:hypothetical protein